MPDARQHLFVMHPTGSRKHLNYIEIGPAMPHRTTLARQDCCRRRTHRVVRAGLLRPQRRQGRCPVSRRASPIHGAGRIRVAQAFSLPFSLLTYRRNLPHQPCGISAGTSCRACILALSTAYRYRCSAGHGGPQARRTRRRFCHPGHSQGEGESRLSRRREILGSV